MVPSIFSGGVPQIHFIHCASNLPGFSSDIFQMTSAMFGDRSLTNRNSELSTPGLQLRGISSIQSRTCPGEEQSFLNFQNTWCGQPPNPTQQFEGFKYVGELGHCRSSMWLWLGRQFHVYQWAKQKKNQQLPNRENQCGRGLMNMWRVPQNARAKPVLIGPPIE